MATFSIEFPGGRAAIIDESDAQLVGSYKWRVDSKGYAITMASVKPSVFMHRLIMNAPKGVQVDHIDHNRLNNTRANLRFATPSENQANKEVVLSASGYKGVTFHRRAGRWQAAVKCHGKNHYLGLFDTKQEAAQAYGHAAKRLFGDYANPAGAA